MNFSTQPDNHKKTLGTPLRAALTLTTLLLLSVLGFSGCGGTDNASNANPPKANVTVNTSNPPKKPAPAGPSVLPAIALDTQLETMDGKPFKLSELKGKVLVLDLWATWCGPCRSSTPELVRLHKEFEPRGFEVIGLDIDPESDTPEDVREFAEEFKINYKLAFIERELAISLMRGGNIPQTLVVGRDGRIVEHLVGFSQATTPKRLRAGIEKALAENN